MEVVIGSVVYIWLAGAFIAVCVGEWPAEQVVLWPLEIVRRWWRS